MSNVETEASGSTEYPIFAAMLSRSSPFVVPPSPQPWSAAPFAFMFFASSLRIAAGENSGTSMSSSSKASSLSMNGEGRPLLTPLV